MLIVLISDESKNSIGIKMDPKYIQNLILVFNFSFSCFKISFGYSKYIQNSHSSRVKYNPLYCNGKI